MSSTQDARQAVQPFQWAKHWYPMAFLDDLDPKVPHPVELLSQRLVLWCDGQGQWRCFQDKCPHRLAPLSGTLGITCAQQLMTSHVYWGLKAWKTLKAVSALLGV